MSLPRLPKLGYRSGRPYPNSALHSRLSELDTPEEQVVVYPPFRSQGEVVGWEFLSRTDPYWVPMVPVGGFPGNGGSTEIDFYHPLRRIALFFDGPVHLIPGAAQRDEYLRLALKAKLMLNKVVTYQYQTVRDVRENFPRFYFENLNA